MQGTEKEKAEQGCIRWERNHETMKTKVCDLESLVQKIRCFVSFSFFELFSVVNGQP